MEIRTERQHGLVTVAVAGRIDGSNSTEVEEALRDALADVIVDLEDVSYIGSVGLRTMLLMAKHLSNRSVRFALCSVVGPVREVFEVSGFDRIIAVHASRDEAPAFVNG